ncbi:MAG: flavin reductase [Chitinivibrionia bacterium]|nr:flavin reductase [Chitinivibrionia bacterium]
MKRYSSHFPDPVALVTVATDAHTNVMTVGWTTPVSFKPPILMVSIAPERFTHGLLIEAGEFGVSILADDQKRLSTAAWTASGAKVRKLAGGEFETIEPEIIRAPLIAGGNTSRWARRSECIRKPPCRGRRSREARRAITSSPGAASG